MTQSFKNIPSLYKLVHSAPVEALQALLSSEGGGKFSSIAWPADLTDGEAAARCGAAVLQVAGKLPPLEVAPLEQHAERLLLMAEGAGANAIAEVAERRLDASERAAFDAQRDSGGRAIWLFLHSQKHFEEAENIYYAEHYRQMPRLYEAFALADDGQAPSKWDGRVSPGLLVQVADRLGVLGYCRIDHIATSKPGLDDERVDAHLLVVRHAGLPASVAEIRDRENEKRSYYYRPAVEASLVYTPAEGVIEVYGSSSKNRRVLAEAFAEIALRRRLSYRPTEAHVYDLSRFHPSYRLPLPTLTGAEVESVQILQAEARDDDGTATMILKVVPGADIDRKLDGYHGASTPLRQGTINRVIILAKYRRDGDPRLRTIKFAVGEPNRCSLQGVQARADRELVFAMLKGWGILKKTRRPDDAEMSSMFPIACALYDQDGDQVSERWFLSRQIDPWELVELGFLEPAGQREVAGADDDEPFEQVIPTNLGEPPRRLTYALFDLNRKWLEEWILKALCGTDDQWRTTRLGPNLLRLGEVTLDDHSAPVYLARRLGHTRVISECDRLLRSQIDAPPGIVLSTSPDNPEFLGANTVIPILEVQSRKSEAPVIDLAGVLALHGRQLATARSGQAVEFIHSGGHTATLQLPQLPSKTITGAVRIMIVQRLVDAYRSGNPAVATKDLMADIGMASPSQAFPKSLGVIGVYIVQPPGCKRGMWQLNV